MELKRTKKRTIVEISISLTHIDEEGDEPGEGSSSLHLERVYPWEYNQKMKQDTRQTALTAIDTVFGEMA